MKKKQNLAKWTFMSILMATSFAFTGCSTSNDNPVVETPTPQVMSGNVVSTITLSEVSSSNIGCVVTTQGKVYPDVAAASEAGDTAVAVIAYVGSGTDNATYTHGLAIALDNDGSQEWYDDLLYYNGKTAVANAAWQLPSKAQWEKMCAATSGYNIPSDCSGLNSLLSNAGGTILKDNSKYWTSTFYGRFPYYVDVYSGSIDFICRLEVDCFVRACLVF